MEKNDSADAGVDPAPENSPGGGIEVEEQEEESGWTDCLEDYFSSEIERESSFLCSSVGSCSWVVLSDDHTNNSNNTNVLSPLSSVGEVIFDVPKKLSFKKTRTQKIFEDDSLEDTATSPIHSPKVADLKVRTSSHVNPRFDDHMMISSSTGSGRLLENYCSNTEKAVYGGADLKKRGLCLFPLSMLLN